MGGGGRLLHLRGGGLAVAAISNVGTYTVIEEDDILADQGDIGAQGGQGDVANVAAIQGDGAGAMLIKTRQQVGEGGLAAARGPYQVMVSPSSWKRG